MRALMISVASSITIWKLAFFYIIILAKRHIRMDGRRILILSHWISPVLMCLMLIVVCDAPCNLDLPHRINYTCGNKSRVCCHKIAAVQKRPYCLYHTVQCGCMTMYDCLEYVRQNNQQELCSYWNWIVLLRHSLVQSLTVRHEQTRSTRLMTQDLQ